nr:immunoglobulin heavy chain junction region [Macaca mulatta]
CTRVQSNFDYW